MSIELICESCGKPLRAPDDSAGRRSKCPACGRELYIPTPKTAIEELPLAPEDDDELRREAALQEERRRLDRTISRESDSPADGGAGAPASSGSRAGGSSVEETVLAYLLAMRRGSDLTRADEAVAILLRNRPEAKKVVDRLIADQLPPPALAAVPAAVYQGFLKNLRSQL